MSDLEPHRCSVTRSVPCFKEESAQMEVTSPYPQKRLACFNCRDKKLRCNTDRGDQCQRCARLRLACLRPESRREKRRAAGESSSSRLSLGSAESPTRGANSSTRDDVTINTPIALPTDQRGALEAIQDRRGINEASQDQRGVVESDELAPIESAERLFWSTLRRRKEKTTSFFSPRRDTQPLLDPILVGILDEARAHALFDLFHSTIAGPLCYFDPGICTFAYVRRNSHALLTAMCFLVARIEPGLGSLAAALESHLDRVILPAVLLQDLRSVELVQALTMLAEFQKPSDDVREDRGWTLLNHALRIATELNIHASFFTIQTDPLDEAERRMRRNAERAWINLWLHEVSLAQHTGRRTVVGEQPLYASCKDWHLKPFALASDRALVSMVDLRTMAMRNRRLHEQLFSLSSTPGAMTCYVERCQADLAAWSRSWLDTEQVRLPRLEVATLYVDHVLVQLLGKAIHHLTPAQWDVAILLKLYEACLDYLEAFPRLLPPGKLVLCYNSFFVAASYQTAVAMRLAEQATRFAFIDVEKIKTLSQGVASCLEGAAALTTVTTAAHSYSRFVRTLLQQPAYPSSVAEFNFDNLEWFAWAGAFADLFTT